MTRFVISAAALALAFAASGAANAQDESMRVRVGDLNVQSDAGAQAAYTRIRAASAKFCGGEGSLDLAVITAQRACVDRMSSKAVDSLNAPKVTALSGRQHPGIVLASATR
jgi:UrcA family protein